MTAELAKRAGWVIAIELDNRLAMYLQKTLAGENVVIITKMSSDRSGMLLKDAPPFPPD